MYECTRALIIIYKCDTQYMCGSIFQYIYNNNKYGFTDRIFPGATAILT